MAIGDKSITLVGAPGAWGSIACWLNPPYGKTIGLWLSKAREAALAGATVALIPRHRHDREPRFDICQAACVSADANIPRRSRARSQFGGRPRPPGKGALRVRLSSEHEKSAETGDKQHQHYR
jgi:hypothetical protein